MQSKLQERSGRCSMTERRSHWTQLTNYTFFFSPFFGLACYEVQAFRPVSMQSALKFGTKARGSIRGRVQIWGRQPKRCDGFWGW